MIIITFSYLIVLLYIKYSVHNKKRESLILFSIKDSQ